MVSLKHYFELQLCCGSTIKMEKIVYDTNLSIVCPVPLVVAVALSQCIINVKDGQAEVMLVAQGQHGMQYSNMSH